MTTKKQKELDSVLELGSRQNLLENDITAEEKMEMQLESKQKTDFVKKIALFGVLLSCTFAGNKINAISLEDIGLSNIVVTSAVLTIADIVGNIFIILFFHRAPRKKTLMLLSLLIFVFSLILLNTSIFPIVKYVKTFNLALAFILKAIFMMSIVLTFLFSSNIKRLLNNCKWKLFKVNIEVKPQVYLALSNPFLFLSFHIFVNLNFLWVFTLCRFVSLLLLLQSWF